MLHVHNESSASGQATRTSSMGGAPPLLAMNGRGYILHVHNESSASGQSTRTSSMGGASFLLAMNGWGYTVLHVHNESSASGQDPEEEGPGRRVQRSQLDQARPSQWDSIRLVII